MFFLNCVIEKHPTPWQGAQDVSSIKLLGQLCFFLIVLLKNILSEIPCQGAQDVIVKKIAFRDNGIITTYHREEETN